MSILDMTTAYISYICSYFYFKFQQPQLLAVTKSLLFTVIPQEFGIISWGLWTKTWPIFWARASDSASATGFQRKSQGLSGAAPCKKKKKKKKECAAMTVWRDDVTPSFLVNCESCYDLDLSQKKPACIRTAQISPILSAGIVQHHNKHLRRVSVYSGAKQALNETFTTTANGVSLPCKGLFGEHQFWDATDKYKSTSLFLSHPPLWQSEHYSWKLVQRTQADLSKTHNSKHALINSMWNVSMECIKLKLAV